MTQVVSPPLHRVLLRVRMLYYLKVEVLGEAANQALEGIPARYEEGTMLMDCLYMEITCTDTNL